MEPVATDDPSLSEGEHFSWAQMSKEALAANPSPFAGADIEKAAHADDKTDLSSLEIGKPFLANEFPIGNQSADRGRVEQIEEFFKQINPHLGIGASFFGQHAPQQGQGNTIGTDGNHEHVMIAAPETPHRAIEGQNERFLLGQQRQHKPGEGRSLNRKAIKEALQTAIVRSDANRWIEYKSQLSKIDAAHLDKRYHKASRKVDSGLMPGKMLLQKLLQCRRMIHDLIDGLVWKFCRNQNTTLFNQIFFCRVLRVQSSMFKVVLCRTL